MLLLESLIIFSVDSAMRYIMVKVRGTCMYELMNILIYHNLPKKQVKPMNGSVADHLLFCNHLASYDDFSILTYEDKKFLLKLKESL